MHEYVNFSFKAAPAKCLALFLASLSPSTPYLHYYDLEEPKERKKESKERKKGIKHFFLPLQDLAL